MRATSTLAAAARDRYNRRHEQGTRTSEAAPPDPSDSCGCGPHRKVPDPFPHPFPHERLSPECRREEYEEVANP